MSFMQIRPYPFLSYPAYTQTDNHVTSLANIINPSWSINQSGIKRREVIRENCREVWEPLDDKNSDVLLVCGALFMLEASELIFQT